MGKSKLKSAIEDVQKALADGKVTTNEVFWLVGVWIETIGEIVANLADPTKPIDKDWAADLILQSWQELEKVIGELPLPYSLKLFLPAILQSVPMVIPSIVEWIVEQFEEEEVYDDYKLPAPEGVHND